MSIKQPRAAAPSTPRAEEIGRAIDRNARHEAANDAPPPGLGDRLRARVANTSKPKPPEDRDERLATFQRGPEGDPGRTELRVSWCLYNAGAYLRLHTWERGSDGQFWPIKGSAVSIRRGELGAFAETVAAALDRSDALAAARRAGNSR